MTRPDPPIRRKLRRGSSENNTPFPGSRTLLLVVDGYNTDDPDRNSQWSSSTGTGNPKEKVLKELTKTPRHMTPRSLLSRRLLVSTE